MLHSILSDFNRIEDITIDYLINPNLNSFNELINCNKISLESDLYDWLNKNSKYYDICFFIAPEDNLIQYNITSLLENNDVIVLGSNSNASYICTSKYRTYETVDQNILKIPTIKVHINQITTNLINRIKDYLKNKSIVIKPDDRTSSDYIYHINSIIDFRKVISEYKKVGISSFLLQEYIDGNSISVSLIYDGTFLNMISINSQEIDESHDKIVYKGCKVPIQHPLKKELYTISETITKSINGLKGYFGIDYIINKDNIYLTEVNSRLTTPYIVLHENTNVNLGECILKSVLYNKNIPISLIKKGSFYK